MNISSLEEKYNNSRRLGYFPRPKSSLYPSIKEEELFIPTNRQSFRKSSLNNFANPNRVDSYNKSSNATKYIPRGSSDKKRSERSNTIPGKTPPSQQNRYDYVNVDIGNNNAPLAAYRESPIKSLPRTVTPSKIKPASLYKILDATPRTSQHRKISNSRSGKYNSKIPKVSSEKTGLFSRLRNYLNKFNLSGIEEDDKNLKQLKDSARNVLNIKAYPERTHKRVTFDDNESDNDIIDDTITENSRWRSEVAGKTIPFQRELEQERKQNKDIIKRLQLQLQELDAKHRSETESLKDIINDLKRQSEIDIQRNEDTRWKLEEKFLQEYETLLSKQKEKEADLKRAQDELNYKMMILSKQEKELDQKFKKMNEVSVNKSVKNQLHLNTQYFENENFSLMQKKLTTNLKMKQNADDYSQMCQSMNLNLHLTASKAVTRKYERLMAKFEEYSKLLEDPRCYKTMNLMEILNLLASLKNKLLSSSIKKRSKLDLVEEELLSINIRYDRNIALSAAEVNRAFSKKSNLLEGLQLINNLLIKLNFLFKQLKDLIAIQEFNLDNFPVSEGYSLM